MPPKGAERFAAEAAKLGLSPEIRRFPEETRTAEDAARAIGCSVGQIVKSLVFVADGEAFLALTSGSNQADMDRMAEALGAQAVRRADPETARVATGFAIGGTPPFGHPRRLRTLVDRDLLDYQVVWAAAGAPDAVFPISPQDLVRVSGGAPAAFKKLVRIKLDLQ